MKLLIVDDELKTTEYLKKGLAEQGCTVDIAHDGIEGRHLALEHDYDVIVLDVMLPALDGFSVLRDLRRTRQTPVIMLTARDRDLKPREAIYQACLLRFRPIMMTTMCALLSGLPLMLGHGQGSELRRPLGYAMVGGLILSQAMTLFTTPVVYLYLDRAHYWYLNRKKARAERRAAARDEEPSAPLALPAPSAE